MTRQLSADTMNMNIPARVIVAMKINMDAVRTIPMNKVNDMNIIYTEEKKFTQEQVQALFQSVGWVSGEYP